MVDITRREDQHRANMKQYENQLQIQQKLIQRDKQLWYCISNKYFLRFTNKIFINEQI